ncbi:PspC domain-containing protein [Kineosporia rhizophila]|uniref:PspC domain-containing protein n=1 Tax=Kineosporia rhizophila TaxID=84633 RepID=UPI001E3763D8|nr:PspC domain-containing protein [Kineosporia rhizophila]MCE0536734.1 PspC domain-containing protein [Kineosporia rhizophila]
MSGTQEPGGAVWGSPDPSPNQRQPAGPPPFSTGAPGPGQSGGPGSWSPPPEPGAPNRRPGDDFFGRIREYGAARPAEGRWVAGVASGLSHRLNIDQTLIRGGFVALSIVGGMGVALYGICWMLMPQQQDGRIHLQEAVRGHFSAGFFASVLLSLALIGGGGGSWFGNGGVWGFPGTLVLAALIIGGLWWMAKKLPQPPEGQSNPGLHGMHHGGGPASHGAPHWTHEGSRRMAEDAARWGRETGEAVHTWAKDFSNRQPTAHEEAAWARVEAHQRARARTAPSRRVRQLSLGGALVASAAVLTAEAAGDLPGWAGLTALAAAIVVLACGVVANGLMGRRSPGLAGLGILLSLFLAVGAAAQHAGVKTNQHLSVAGETNWAPQTRDAAETQYTLGFGEARLNLTSASMLSGATATDPLEVDANLGVGHLILTIPASVPVEVDVQMGAGEVVEPDGSSYDVGNNQDRQSRVLTYGSGDPVLKIDVQQGAGQLEIVQEGASDLTSQLPDVSDLDGDN